MGNYNPKTAYQFKWQDAKKMQKFIQGQFVLYDIDLLINGGNYSFKTVPIAKELADTCNYCLNNYIPVVIYDIPNEIVWTSYMLTGGEAHFINAGADHIIDLFIDIYDDHIEIQVTNESFVTTDNVKTLFGNKSIIGQGNIDIYNHFLTLTSANVTYYINYQSSNNLVVDSLQDLTALTKATSGTKVGLGTTYMIFSSNVWKLANNELITAVSDIVTTI